MNRLYENILYAKRAANMVCVDNRDFILWSTNFNADAPFDPLGDILIPPVEDVA